MQNYIELSSFSAVAPGQVANLPLDIGPKYNEIHLESNQANKIEWVRLKLNAKVVFELTKAELDRQLSYDKIQGSSNFIALPLALHYAVPLQSQVFTGLPTGPGDNVVLDVKFASDAVAPELKAFAEVAEHNGVREVVRTFERYTIPVGANGKIDFTAIERGPRILRAWFESPNIGSLEVKQNGVVAYELSQARNNYLLKMRGKEIPAGFFVFDPTARNYPLIDAMKTAYQNLNFRLDVTSGGAQNIEVLVEQLEALEPRQWA